MAGGRPITILLIMLAGSAPGSAPAADLDLVAVPGGRFVMGDPEGEPDEVRKTVDVRPFRMMRFEVSNDQFAAFVAETGHVTDRERDGWGWVWLDKWRKVDGADWRHPHGPESRIEGRGDHPVVQVSQRDARAFCRHHGLRLPTDGEWEFAARGGDGRRYPWGNETPLSGGTKRGNFGKLDCCDPDGRDGYDRIEAVGRYPRGVSPFGLFDMAGNVWERIDQEFPGEPGRFIIRGGGWGNGKYCLRVSYRHWNRPEFGLDMVGFRCAGD